MTDIQEIRQVKSENLMERCKTAMTGSPHRIEVCLGTYRFNTDDSPELDFDDYEISIARAKLEKYGFHTDTYIRMDKVCRKVVLEIQPAPASKTVTGVVVKK